MATRDDVMTALQPVLELVRALGPLAPHEASARLSRELPLDGPVLRNVRAVLRAAVESRAVCDRENAGVRYSRLVKADGPAALSIDLVHMTGPGAAHLHPNGEVDLCFAVDPGARFDGRAEGWTVYGPDSWHVPTVDGGAMDIVYFLPGGAIQFGAKPESATAVGLQAARFATTRRSGPRRASCTRPRRSRTRRCPWC